MLNRIFAAAVFALLTITAPARAAIIDINVNFSNGFNATGQLSFHDFFPICCDVPGLTGPGPTGGPGWFPYFPVGFNAPPYTYVNPLPVPPCPIPNACGHPPFGPGTGIEQLFVTAFGLPQSFSDFSLDGFDPGTAISGTVTVEADTLSTPLPAALPLFGSGVMMLAGFAVRRRGKVS